MENLLYLAYLLVAVGLVLMLAELVLPTGGILPGLGGVSVIGGIVLAFAQGGLYAGLATTAVVFVAVPAIGLLIRYLWPRTQLGEMAHAAADPDATVAAMPVNVELEQLRGRYGRAVSPLRPSGVVDFDGRRID